MLEMMLIRVKMLESRNLFLFIRVHKPTIFGMTLVKTGSLSPHIRAAVKVRVLQKGKKFRQKKMLIDSDQDLKTRAAKARKEGSTKTKISRKIT